MKQIADAKALGIVPSHERISVARCLSRGFWKVNFPVMLIMGGGFGGLFLIFMTLAHSKSATAGPNSPDPSTAMIILMAIPALLVGASPIAGAWLWWSTKVPQWRVWALRNVDNWPALEQEAIEAGLIWPRRSIFNLTEIKSLDQKKLEADLIRYRDENG